MDIDGLRDRDWEGMERTGRALARAVADVVRRLDLQSLSTAPQADALRGGHTSYAIPARRITDDEWEWAQSILAQTGGKVQALADGVGDDYLAVLYRRLRESQDQDIPVEQTCFCLGDSAWLTFPGELYTEIGQAIKRQSPFARTYIIGLANGQVGYIPTRQAIHEGGYAEDTRRVDEAAESIVLAQSLALLRQLHG